MLACVSGSRWAASGRACSQLPHAMPVPHVTTSFRFHQLRVAAPIAPCPHHHAPRVSPFAVSREHFSDGQGIFLCSLATWVPWVEECAQVLPVFLMSRLPFSQCSFSIVAFTHYTVFLPPSVFRVTVPVLQGLGWIQPFLSLSSSRISM